MIRPSKLLEQEVGLGLRKTFTTSLIYREHDFPIHRVQQADIHFRMPQAADWMVLGRTLNLAFEVKHTQTSSFRFDMVRDSQLKFLANFQEKAGESFIIIGTTRPQPRISMITFLNFLRLKQVIGKESISFSSDLPQIKQFFLELSRIQMKKNYYIDFSYLKQKLKM
jgi:penicillin-binding protein-related factor A (putative recombinase)